MNLLQRLTTEVLIGDGAVGTMLYAKGVSLDANFEHLNLVRPSLVLELHNEYIAAGAALIETNTFGANRAKLQNIGLEKKVREINLQGVALARRAVEGTPVLVAGSLGPLAKPKGEERELTSAEMEDIFHEQITALAEGGVDVLFLETFTAIDQARAALKAAKKTGLPVLASMAFREGGRTSGGITVEQAVQELAAAGADIVGTNCGAGPLEALKNVSRMATATTLPIAVFANSGFPEYVDGRYIYRATPAYFADMAAKMVQAGANLIGGCCGTTPDHIRAIAARISGFAPAPRIVSLGNVSVSSPAYQSKAQPNFLVRWGKEPVITVELDPPKGLDCSRIIEGSRRLRDAGVDAISLAENPLARVRMGNIALGHRIQQEVGIETIVHITCRDRNLLGLQSDLMGASLLGIRNILAVTGDPARLGDQSGSSSVFDLNSFELIKLIADLNKGMNAIGNPIEGSTGFLIGAAFNPNSPRMEVQVERLRRKIANGATFIQTQPLYDYERVATMIGLTQDLGIPLLPGILPLVSGRNAEFLHNEVPGITIPEEIRARMKGKEKDTGVREGLAIAREFIDEAGGQVGGFYLIPPFGRFEIAEELVRHIRQKYVRPGSNQTTKEII